MKRVLAILAKEADRVRKEGEGKTSTERTEWAVMQRMDAIKPLVCLQVYPRTAAHLIAHSLGYLSPRSAGWMIAQYLQGNGYYCEWIDHIVGTGYKHRLLKEGKLEIENFREPLPEGLLMKTEDYRQRMIETTRETVSMAINGLSRKSHKGYMADYKNALELVRQYVTEGSEPHFGFGSWF